MDLSEFTANYARMGDEELLCVWADRKELVPEARMALDTEIQKRGLNKQNADRIKHRLDQLETREARGLFVNQVATAQNERSLRHFVGWQEPEFRSPYASARDIRNTIAYIRYKYRTWKVFRDHTGHWPAFSIWYHFASWIAFVGLVLATLPWFSARRSGDRWSVIVGFVFLLLMLVLREAGARLMRKLDWSKYGK